MIGLQTINETLMYKVLSIPTYTEKEHCMVELLMEYIREKGYDGGVDEKGNVYMMKGTLPEGNCASWSCGGVCLFDKPFYETYLVELGEKFGLTKYVAHPYTDVMMLRIDTSLMCMNFGAGYYKYHTPGEYCIAEEMDNAAAMGIYLINRLGYKEYVFPYTPRSPYVSDENHKYFRTIFREEDDILLV